MASYQVILVLMFSVFLSASYACTNSTIAAFNIQVLGKTKMGKPEVVNYLTKIIVRYDIVLIQEIRDISETAIYELLDGVNNRQPGVNYKMELGPRVGRTSSKEQYAYIYREDKFRALQSFTYNDILDDFEREPFVVLFENLDSGAKVSRFSIVGLHAKPDHAPQEIDYLLDVYNDVIKQFGENVILMGDFNADCSYVTGNEFENLKLNTMTSFSWLIDSSADTTVKSTNCAYDRIVLAGQKLIENGRDAGVFNYHEEYGITQDLAEDISDHYPVHFTIV
nr:deoxyribonuclease-1-like [Lytechinus pictus]